MVESRAVVVSKFVVVVVSAVVVKSVVITVSEAAEVCPVVVGPDVDGVTVVGVVES